MSKSSLSLKQLSSISLETVNLSSCSLSLKLIDVFSAESKYLIPKNHELGGLDFLKNSLSNQHDWSLGIWNEIELKLVSLTTKAIIVKNRSAPSSFIFGEYCATFKEQNLQ